MSNRKWKIFKILCPSQNVQTLPFAKKNMTGSCGFQKNKGPLKFGYSEKAIKFEKKIHLKFDATQ